MADHLKEDVDYMTWAVGDGFSDLKGWDYIKKESYMPEYPYL